MNVHVQMLILVVKMAIVLEECGQKGSMQRIFINKYFLFMVAFVQIFSQGHLKVADAQPGVEVAETAVKRLYAAGFDRLVKRWHKCISVGVGYFDK
jgi:hypothetical protein